MVQFIDRPQHGMRAVLVFLDMPGNDYDADSQEFRELARSAGAEVLGFIGGSRKTPDPGLYIGSGKAEEVGLLVASSEADLVIFNHDLSPSQERNLERTLKCRVLGRAGLILDIFARRARTYEGKLQVELAQLEHLSTRLVRGWTHLERQKGGIGLRGPGETQLELDRRLVKDRMVTLKRHLEDVRQRRALGRKQRKRNETPVVSIVGYTNAGKSTLFNAMTGDDTFASNQLFATLDTTIRKLALPADQEILLADTVGFIRDLPHTLVAAFRATLEEAREAELLLHVLDAADPERLSRIRQVQEVLTDIEADHAPQLLVFNKIDLLEGEQPRIERDADGVPQRVYVSAIQEAGLDLLRQAIAERVYPALHEETVTLPPTQARFRALLYQHHAIQSESIDDDGQFHICVRLPQERWERLCREAGQFHLLPPPVLAD
jgi:GTP-binding protein HflX